MMITFSNTDKLLTKPMKQLSNNDVEMILTLCLITYTGNARVNRCPFGEIKVCPGNRVSAKQVTIKAVKSSFFSFSHSSYSTLTMRGGC